VFLPSVKKEKELGGCGGKVAGGRIVIGWSRLAVDKEKKGYRD